MKQGDWCTLWGYVVSLFYCGTIIPYYLRTHRLRFLYVKTRQFVLLQNRNKKFYYNKYYKYWMKENRILLLVFVVCLIFFAINMFIDHINKDSNTFKLITIGCDTNRTNLEYGSLIWIILHTIESVGLIYCLNKLKPVKKEFSIKNELFYVSCVWIITTLFGLIVYLYTEIDSNVDLNIIWIMNSICEWLRFSLCYIITNIYPLFLSVSPKKSYPLFSQCRVLYSLKLLLKDMNGIAYFREYLRREKRIEYLLFYIEVELYNNYYIKISKNGQKNNREILTQIYRQCIRIFDKFIQYNADYKILLSTNIKNNIANILKQQHKLKSNKYNNNKMNKKSIIIIDDNNDYTRNNSINNDNCIYIDKSSLIQFKNIFLDAQNETYNIMNTKYFPKFLSNELSHVLLDRLKVEERFLDALKRSDMI